MKPDNILCDDEYVIRLCDFGSAFYFEPPTSSGSNLANLTIGTPEYMAPEALERQANFGQPERRGSLDGGRQSGMMS